MADIFKGLKHNKWLFVCIVAFTTLALIGLGEASVWHDEGYSYMLAKYDLLELFRRTALDVHPPFYYLALKGWMALFGDSLFALRSLSLVSAIGVIVASYFLFKRFLKGSQLLWAMAVMSVSPLMIRYAQEARMYMLVTLFLLVATISLLKVLEGRHKWAVVYAVTAALALYSHYYSGFIILAQGLYVLNYTGVTLRQGWSEFWRSITRIPAIWIKTLIALVLLFAPWVPVAIRQFTSIQDAFWIPPLTQTVFYSTYTRFVYYSADWKLMNWYALLALITLVVLIIGIVKTNRQLDGPPIRFLKLCAFLVSVPVLAITLLSLPPLSPVFNERYLVPIAPFVYAVIGLIIYTFLRNKTWPSRMAAGLIIVSLFFGISNVYRFRDYNPDRHATAGVTDIFESIEDTYPEREFVFATHDYYYFFDIFYEARENQDNIFINPEFELNGIGSQSLFYDRDDLTIQDWSELSNYEYIWLFSDQHYEFDNIPNQWQKVQEVRSGSVKAVLFEAIKNSALTAASNAF